VRVRRITHIGAKRSREIRCMIPGVPLGGRVSRIRKRERRLSPDHERRVRQTRIIRCEADTHYPVALNRNAAATPPASTRRKVRQTPIILSL
jgi:hypothetical protein